MKKRQIILTCLLAAGLVFAGCGRKTAENAEPQPTAAPTQAAQNDDNLVQMQQVTPTPAVEEKNVIGTKSATASKITVINKLGGEVAGFYVRQNPEDADDDEWGDELIEGAFTLKNGEQAVYYMNSPSRTAAYDICVTFADEERNDCFFRKLPLASVSQITLCMEGSGEEGIPYARYMNGNKEVSTLNEVKQRLGLLDDDYDDEDEEQSGSNSESESSVTGSSNQNAQGTNSGGNEQGGSSYGEQPTDEDYEAMDQTNEGAEMAKQYIGQSLDNLIGAMGDATGGSSYEDEPETGETGYHYYDGFTVSTTVDEDGNEIVAGVY